MLHRSYQFDDCLFEVQVPTTLDKFQNLWAVWTISAVDFEGKKGLLMTPSKVNHYDDDQWSPKARLMAQNNSGNAPLWIDRFKTVIAAVHEDPEVRAALMGIEDKTAEWPEPLPFPEADVPDFPEHVFPEPFNDYLRARSWETQVPVALTATLMLGTIAGGVQRRCVVELHPGWVEQLSLELVAVLASGERKSAEFRHVTGPIYRIQKEMRDAATTRIANERAKPKDEQDLDSLPPLPQLIADDITAEALGVVLAAQQGNIIIASSEGGLFETLAGRYANNVPNIDLFLKGYSGDPVLIDRVGRATTFIPHPRITSILTVQPDVLERMGQQRVFRGRGLLARFLYSVPKGLVGFRVTKPELCPPELRDVWDRAVRTVFYLSDCDPDTPWKLKMDPEAQVIFDQYRNAVEDRLAPGGELEALADWGSKLAGNVARFCGILHTMACAVESVAPWNRPIGVDITTTAIALGDYFEAHAKAAFWRMGIGGKDADGRYVLSALLRNRLHTFTHHDLWQIVRNRFNSGHELEATLGYLVELGYLRTTTPASSGRGRKPSQSYETNPFVFSDPYTRNAQN